MRDPLRRDPLRMSFKVWTNKDIPGARFFIDHMNDRGQGHSREEATLLYHNLGRALDLDKPKESSP